MFGLSGVEAFLHMFVRTMVGNKRLMSLLACVVACLLTPTLSIAKDVRVEGIRVGAHSSYTRFVIDMDRDVNPRIFTLADPYRVVIDLPDAEWGFPTGNTERERGVVAGYRVGHFRPGNSRIVIDLSGPGKIEQVLNLSPQGGKGHRLVIDIKSTSRDVFLASAGWPKEPFNSGNVSNNNGTGGTIQRPHWVVVIDPGHGGKDPGTVSKSGTKEKTISLAAAKSLQRHLSAKGNYEVVLTRDRDVYPSLRARVDTARREAADLFISLHADSIKHRKVRGASVYTLSENASDKEAAALAQKENRADIIAGVDMTRESFDVSKILIELSQRETKNRSVEFAQLLMPELSKNVPLLRRTHRFAGFAVLKAPDVPSVLVEMGYLSNREDERRLKDKASREKIAISIASAVDTYFDDLDRNDANMRSAGGLSLTQAAH